MKLNKQDKDIIIEKSNPTKKIRGNSIILSWQGNNASYNIDMKSIWTKEQQKYLDQHFEEVNKKFDLLIEILARNGIK